ncbi:hypothetical protein [Methanolobus sp. ZRKC5]|uniref:hypothetical protein n=1 Tax=unclassified Methanolobus TaxID=2629569 RepID=UPI00313EE5A8
MKKMPLIILIFLMLLVVISGMVNFGDVQQYPDERHERYSQLFPPPFDIKEPQKGEMVLIYMFPYSFNADEKSILEDNIEKAEAMVERLDIVIIRLNEKGNDVQDLDQMVDEYDVLVSESRGYLVQAETSSVNSDKEKYIKLSKESIVRANSELKHIFDKIKTYLPGPVILSGNSSLVAEGSGVVILSGDLDTSFFLSEGKFSVVDFAGDISIDMEKDYKQEVLQEKDGTPDHNKPYIMISYVEVEGNTSLSGSDFSVAIMADRMSLLVIGTGEVELIGNGTYYFDDGTSSRIGTVWAKPIFESD